MKNVYYFDPIRIQYGGIRIDHNIFLLKYYSCAQAYFNNIIKSSVDNYEELSDCFNAEAQRKRREKRRGELTSELIAAN